MNIHTTNQKNILSRVPGLFCLILVAALIMPFTAFSQWSEVPVSVAVNDQVNPMMVSDGSGGTIITWQDKRGGNNYDIYAQRLSTTGIALWTTDGVPICTADSNQVNPKIVSDGTGGAIICWEDKRNPSGVDIYVQRVNSSGQVQWSNNGVPVCTVVFDQDTISMVSDELGGAIMTWQDYRSNVVGIANIYAQRVNSSGAMLWTANGVNICNQANGQRGPKLISDGSGGAFITWYDHRAGNYDIYTQHVGSGGAVQWSTNGVATCTIATDQMKPDICSDGAGGMIISWSDYRSTTNFTIYAQRQHASGSIVWVVDGVSMDNNVAYDKINPKMVSDAAGGAIIVWQDHRTGSGGYYDVYAQRVNSTGAVQWTATGVIICTAAGNKVKPQIISDGNSGAYITWEDHRVIGTDTSSIYAMRIGSNAAINWPATGFPICLAAHDQLNPMIVTDGNLGAIITWQDYRSGNNFDIYASRFNTQSIIGIENNGTIAKEFTLLQNYPNPFNPVTVIGYQLPRSSNVKISIYDALGKQVDILVDGAQNAGSHNITWNAINFPSGVYFYRLDAGAFVSIKKMVLIK